MTPLVLAVDTTHDVGSLALVRGAETLEETVLRAPTGFAQVLYGSIADLLRRNGLTLADVDCFASASGPGTFTGIRVGLACVKGLAETLGKPAAAVSNLRALASFGAAPLRGVVMDARRGEIYGAVYTAGGELVTPEIVMTLPAWLDTVPPGDIDFITFGCTLDRPRVQSAPEALAAAIGRLAGPGTDPAALDANYVRRADAEMYLK